MNKNQSIENRLTGLWMQADGMMLRVLGLLFLLSIGLAFQYGEWLALGLVGLPAFAIPALMVRTSSGALPTRLAIATAMMVFSALLIHEGHGLVEWHFSVFVLLAFLLYYRDWTPIVMAAGVIAVHHVLFAVLQGYRFPVYVFQLNAVWIVVMHAAFVVAETVVLVLLANRMRKEAIDAFGVAALAEVIAAGKLDTPIEMQGQQSPMLRMVLEMQTQLHRLLTQVNKSSKELDSGSETLSEAAKHAARNTDTQFDTASLMSTSVAELVQTVDAIAQGASHGADLTQGAATKAGEGGTVIRSTAKEIRAIADSVESTSVSLNALGGHAEKIADVIGVIKEIADQTNLLALNAAIEAARAGESGRGFAVVADEVRKLAERTAASTAEIQSMISDIANSRQTSLEQMSLARQQIDRGLVLAEEVTTNIDDIIAAVEEANAVVGDISASLNTQASNAALISDQVSKFADSAADSREMVNQTATLVAQIHSTAQGLREAVTGFRISSGV